MGQDRVLASMAGGYCLRLIPGLPPLYAFLALTKYLQVSFENIKLRCRSRRYSVFEKGFPDQIATLPWHACRPKESSRLQFGSD